ncbi:hypothetical protein [Rhizohabitans arisaemae]|uniref:hypothetical protein n=1 Tax=Rhizohabitans arisaemae TaxID=2720610 RepID=UPI0024B136C8|nr:hypothetical protein [Rhizohabitans arisaemae]
MKMGQTMSAPMEEAQVSPHIAERHHRELTVVRDLLRLRGYHCVISHLIRMKLYENRVEPATWHVPELAVFQARAKVASVTVGRRSGSCYLVNVPGVGIELQMCKINQPSRVVDMVASAEPIPA